MILGLLVGITVISCYSGEERDSDTIKPVKEIIDKPNDITTTQDSIVGRIKIPQFLLSTEGIENEDVTFRSLTITRDGDEKHTDSVYTKVLNDERGVILAVHQELLEDDVWNLCLQINSKEVCRKYSNFNFEKIPVYGGVKSKLISYSCSDESLTYDGQFEWK